MHIADLASISLAQVSLAAVVVAGTAIGASCAAPHRVSARTARVISPFAVAPPPKSFPPIAEPSVPFVMLDSMICASTNSGSFPDSPVSDKNGGFYVEARVIELVPQPVSEHVSDVTLCVVGGERIDLLTITSTIDAPVEIGDAFYAHVAPGTAKCAIADRTSVLYLECATRTSRD